MSEILQNIDAVLGITMSVLALLGFRGLFSGGRSAAATQGQMAEPRMARRQSSGFGRLFWFLVLISAVGIGGYLALGQFDSRGGFGRSDDWRGGHNGRLRPWDRSSDDRRR